jgi:hypothetical protein
MRLDKIWLVIASLSVVGTQGCRRNDLAPPALEKKFEALGFVPLVQLIATPERFHGRSVMVVGFLRLGFEGDSLYLHEEDAKYHTSNSLCVAFTPENRKKFEGLSGRYVLIDAIFDATLHGHMSVSVATLRDVRNCEAQFNSK